MKTLLNAALLLTLVSATARAQINAGTLKPEPSLPFTMTQVATFNLPWRIAFLPDGRMLVTEKVGPVWLVTQQGEKTPVANVPAVLWQGQGGMLGVFLSPHYATDHNVYLTYAEPGDEPGTSGLALARARLALGAEQREPGRTAGDLARHAEGPRRPVRRADRLFARRPVPVPDGRRSPAHDAGAGSEHGAGQDPAPDARRQAGAGQSDGGQDGRADVVPRSIRRATPKRPRPRRWSAPTRSRGRTWRLRRPGAAVHRTPYGLAFAPDGRLWEVEHGPRGGDELNLIEPGKNYGWPLVSYADQLQRRADPEPGHADRSDQAGDLLDADHRAGQSRSSTTARCSRSGSGSALMGGMATQTLNRITFDGKGGADARRTLECRPPHPRRGSRLPTARCGCSRTPIPAGCSA